MAVKRLRATESNFKTVLRGIPDDGNDYEVIFDDGHEGYNFLIDPAGSRTNRFNRDPIVIDHSSGGWIVLRPARERQVTFDAKYGYDLSSQYQEPYIQIYAEKIGVHGFRTLSTLWEEDEEASKVQWRMFLGGVTRDGTYKCLPKILEVSGNYMEGDIGGFLVQPSHDPTVYTDVWIYNNQAYKVGGFAVIGINQHYQVTDSAPTTYQPEDSRITGSNCFIHGRADHNICTAISGPNTSPFPNGTRPLHHNFGTTFFDISALNGESTWLESRSDFTAEWTGSANHDLHCARVFAVHSPQVRMTWRDCSYKGFWTEGYGVVGNYSTGNLWVWYYHVGGPSYDTTNSEHRPNFTFENCHFSVDISANVPNVEVEPLNSPARVQIGDNNINLVRPTVVACQSSGTYNFWDCRVRLTDAGSGVLTNPNIDQDRVIVCGIRLSRNTEAAATTHELKSHNLYYNFPPTTAQYNGDTFLSLPIAGNVESKDDLTLGFSGEQLHGRPLARSIKGMTKSLSTDDVIVDGSFEDNSSAWDFTDDGASRVSSGPTPQDGTWHARLRAEKGGPTVEGVFHQTVTLTTGGLYRLRFWMDASQARNKTYDVPFTFRWTSNVVGGNTHKIADPNSLSANVVQWEEWIWGPDGDTIYLEWSVSAENIPGAALFGANWYIDMVTLNPYT